jgi:hypothetical protein
MTEPGKAIYHILTNTTAVTDLVNTRIFPVVAPQETILPYVVYNTVSNQPTDTKDGASESDTFRIQIDIYAKTNSTKSGALQVSEIDKEIRTALDRNVGTHNGVKVIGLSFLNQNEGMEAVNDIFRKSSDYQLMINY